MNIKSCLIIQQLLKKEVYMATEKINITDTLRLNIVERRKALGISSYDLSEKIGNGHSKFWLQNIENGKTKKILKDDLIKIYMILEKTDDPDDVIDTIEQLLKQSIGKKQRNWYELIDIADEFSETYDEDELMYILDEFLDDKLIPEIRNKIYGMSINQMQAALTGLQHLYYSIYKNSELAFALLSIPVYGADDTDKKETTDSLNDLLAMYAKFNDLSIKNKSHDKIVSMQKFDEEMDSIFKQWIAIAFDNFKDLISKLYSEIHNENPDIYSIMRSFTTDVSFMIERGQPNVLKHYLKSWQVYTGKEFATHIEDCVKWFIGFYQVYDLPFIFDVVDQTQLEEIYEFLDNYGDIQQ